MNSMIPSKEGGGHRRSTQAPAQHPTDHQAEEAHSAPAQPQARDSNRAASRGGRVPECLPALALPSQGFTPEPGCPVKPAARSRACPRCRQRRAPAGTPIPDPHHGWARAQHTQGGHAALQGQGSSQASPQP